MPAVLPPAHDSTAVEDSGAIAEQRDHASDAGSLPHDPTVPVIYTPAANGGGDFMNEAKLKPVSGRFEMIPDDDEYSAAERVNRPLAFASCGPSAETIQDTDTRERVFLAAAYGHKYLDRPHLSARNLKQLSVYQREHLFPIEMGKLDAILFQPWKVRPSKEGYWPDHEDLDELRNMLEARRYAAEAEYRRFRKTPPSIPFWGRDLTASSYVHNVNDFEILGVCFRREVEYYLARLAEVHQFDEEPFWDNGPSFLGPTEEALGSGTPHPSRKERRAAKHTFPQTPVSSPPPLPTAPRKPARDAPPHMQAIRNPVDDSSASHYLSVRRDRGASIANNRGASTAPRKVKQEEERIGGGFAPPNGMTGLFRRTVSPSREPPRDPPRVPAPPNGPSDSEPSDDDDSRGGGGFPPRRGGSGYGGSRRPLPGRGSPGGGPPGGGPNLSSAAAARKGQPNPREAHFDFKLKMEIVPTWDGNPDTLARWILRVNSIAKKSATVREQLGSVIPQRLTGDAETWYFSLPEHVREECETDWEEIRQEIGRYYMNRSWIEKARKQALAIKFRDAENSRESPSKYFIRKRELLELVFSYTESELIMEIMAGAPLSWKTILLFKSYQTTSELQNAIKTHEDDLLQMESFIGGTRSSSHGQYSRDTKPFSSQVPYRARANQGLTGQSRNIPPPPFPKDDSNVDKKTPESVNARPCRHCGSGKHWDPSCKYARKGMKKVRAHLASGQVEEEDIAAQEEYDALYYDLLSDSDEEESGF